MGGGGSKTTPQEAVLQTYQERHQTAEKINAQAHDVMKAFKGAIEKSGFADQGVCDKLAIIYEQRLRQFEPVQLRRLGLMLGLEANNAAFGNETSYAEVVQKGCQDIIAFYKRKVDVLEYLLQQTQACLDQSKEINELFERTKALQLGDAGELPYDPSTYKLAIQLDSQVIGQYNRLRELAGAVILDQTLTADELESLFAKIKQIVEASNAVCGARTAAIKSNLPRTGSQ